MPVELTHYDDQEEKKLKDLLQQRDNEISIFSVVQKEEKIDTCT